jgi:hypothetical protein
MSAPELHPGAGELSRVQQWFQSVITHADGVEAGANSAEAQRLIQMRAGELERVITRSRALSAAERLAIYANAYHTRLLECLGEVFPMLKRTLGEDAFDALAFGYLQEYPSRSYTLNELGRHFPNYLQQTRPDANEAGDELPYVTETSAELVENWPQFLIDLAKLEWAIYEVFDGPGVEGIPLLRSEHLSGISPEQWPRMKLTPVVCLQLLTTQFPVNDFYTALRRASADEVVPPPQPQESFVALIRRDYVVRRYTLSRTEFNLLKALKAGVSIDEAVESVAAPSGVDLDQLAANLQTWFRNWTLEGFFQSLDH